MAAAAGVLMLVPGRGSSACTLTWQGGDGSWSDATKWKPSRTPKATDRVCIPNGMPRVEEGNGWHVASVTGSGLVVSGAAIEIWDTARPSTLDELVLRQGIIDGEARLEIARRLEWGRGGVMQGPGVTVLEPKVKATLEFGRGGYGQLARNLANYGRMTLLSGSLYGNYGATLGNAGTMVLRSPGGSRRHPAGLLRNAGDAPCLANTGKVYTYGSFTVLAFEINNTGLVDARRGHLSVEGGSASCPVPA